MNSQKDIYFIKKSILLAKKAQGFTSPNPLVGAVIVKYNKIISSGYHKKAGFPHAEIEAIKKLEVTDLKKSVLYVNLEPCFHYGRTSPCVDEIIKCKLKRVVISIEDPNPKTNGKSIRKLRQAGVRVTTGVLSGEAKKLNEVFFYSIKAKRPFVVSKSAQSIDGKISTKSKRSKWITSYESRQFGKKLRDKYDCVLVGINTILLDNPSLNGLKRKTFKAVIDSKLMIPIDATILKDKPEKVFIFTSFESKSKEKLKILVSKGVNIFFLKKHKGYISLKNVLKILYQEGMISVFVEGGSFTLGRFFDEKLINKAYFFISPKIIGGKKALGPVGGEGSARLKDCPQLSELQIKKIGDDLVISGYPQYLYSKKVFK